MKEFYKITNLLKALKNIHFSFTNSESRQRDKKAGKTFWKTRILEIFSLFSLPHKIWNFSISRSYFSKEVGLIANRNKKIIHTLTFTVNHLSSTYLQFALHNCFFF